MNKLDKSSLSMPKTSTSVANASISDNEHAKTKKATNKHHRKPLTCILEASMSTTKR